MGHITAEVRALLQERQDRRKAELDAHRRDVQFAVGDEVLLDTEHTPLPSRSLLPRAGWAPARYSLAPRPIPTALNCQRPGAPSTNSMSSVCCLIANGPLKGWPPGPGPWYRSCSSSSFATVGHTFSCAGRAATRRATRGSQLNRLCGGHLRLRAGHQPRAATARAAVAAAPPPPPPPIPPADFSADSASPDDLGAALVGRTLLYWWPDDGPGVAARHRGAPQPARPLSHMSRRIRGRRRCCAARWTRCSTRRPTAPAGCFCPRPLRPGSSGPSGLGLSGYPARA